MDKFIKTKLCKLLGPYLALALSVTSASADDFELYADYNYDFSEFVTWMEAAIREKKIPGVALAIVSREGIMHMQTWGVRNIDTREAVHTDSIFRIASMSKTFAGASAALLVDQQYQSWDTKLTDLFPSMRLGTRSSSGGITLKHIVSHSTGLMPHSYSNLLDDGISYDRIKTSFSKIPTVCQPGECYGYQNVVFSLIGDVVEESTGESYEKFIYDQIFRPLGMISATVGMEAYLNNDEATAPHRKSRGSWRTTSTNPAYYSVAPASGINASIFDMSMWVRANLGAFPEVLSADFLSQLHEPIIATPRGNYFNRWSGLEKAYYATGWRVFDYEGQRVIHHGGGVRGYRSEMAFVPEANVGLVLLFNAESNLANDIVPAFLDNLTSTTH
ncbi:MAG: beta-lactamase family protein [Gammaproteobacteria bacterium]|nr:beta-lactamase family protein [Gammaproteobacteria bacterium]MBL4728147.1 beta-lactamase family protein [Gammaproteobacteria bacterium]